jgi:hypothetical protein
VSASLSLVSERHEVERPSDFDIAKRLLRDNLSEEIRGYLLWTDGRWVPAGVDDIMRRANIVRKRSGQPQFTGKVSWLQ